MATKTDPDLIDDGYAEHFNKIYQTFLMAFAGANDDAARAAAVVAFQHQVTIARNVRDAAKRNLP